MQKRGSCLSRWTSLAEAFAAMFHRLASTRVAMSVSAQDQERSSMS